MFNVDLFCANISKLRRNADMTQSELADRLNLTRQAVSRYEKGDSFPDISVLVKIAEIFGITIDELIGAGAPTSGESELLRAAALGCEAKYETCQISDLENLASLLKPSTIERAVRGFAERGIDISALSSLFGYLSDDGFWRLLQNTSFDHIDEELLEKLLPFMSFSSRKTIFNKILSGEIDWHFLSVLMRHVYIPDSWIEAAVIDGVLDEGVLKLKNDFQRERMENSVRCEVCGERVSAKALLCPNCGSKMPVINEKK